jgi:hypothetical protein
VNARLSLTPAWWIRKWSGSFREFGRVLKRGRVDLAEK